MAQPTGSDLHVSRPLTNVSVAYMNAQEDFVADRVFPSLPVDYQYGMYYIYTKGDWFKTQSAKRAPRTESVGTGWSTSTDTYRCDVFAVHTDVADQDRANQERGVFDLDRDGTEFVTRDIMLRRELDWVSAYMAASTWGTADQTGVAAAPTTNQFLQWDQSSSTPIEDVESWRLAMKKSTGYNPNRLVIGAEVYSTGLKNNAELISRIQYVERGVVTLDLVAALFDIDSVMVPNAIENSAAEGAADSFDFVVGKTGLLAYAAPRPGKQQPSAGYTFEWNGYLAAQRGTRIKKFRMEQLAADRIEIEDAYQFNQISGDLGQYFASMVS